MKISKAKITNFITPKQAGITAQKKAVKNLTVTGVATKIIPSAKKEQTKSKEEILEKRKLELEAIRAARIAPKITPMAEETPVVAALSSREKIVATPQARKEVSKKQFIVTKGPLSVSFEVLLVRDIAIYDDDALKIFPSILAAELECKLDSQIADFLNAEKMEDLAI